MPGLSPDTIFAGRYKLVQLLGIGGYSEVWKAIDNMAGEMPVALKIFAPGKGLDSTGIKVFSSEYSLVFNLSHTGLLQAKHYDIWEGSPYLVMTYCAQGSVYNKIGLMSETEVLRFIRQAADALHYLHSQPTPIIHQDIKPDNFLINDSGNYLLSDFGISSRLRRTLTRSVGNEGSAGTMAYLPPERFTQNKQVLPAGDIFALGVTAYELLSGDLPFDDQGGLRLKNGADIPDLPKNFSPTLNALIRSCLHVDPDLRPDAKNLSLKAITLSASNVV
jgi:serine/threonine protein kinase